MRECQAYEQQRAAAPSAAAVTRSGIERYSTEVARGLAERGFSKCGEAHVGSSASESLESGNGDAGRVALPLNGEAVQRILYFAASQDSAVDSPGEVEVLVVRRIEDISIESDGRG